jgi:thiol-disulfide isomerase/thioredoxin
MFFGFLLSFFYMVYFCNKIKFFLAVFCSFFSLKTLADDASPLREMVEPLETSIQDPKDFYTSLETPTKELECFYKLTGLSHWPMQYILGDLGISEDKLAKPKVVIMVYSALSCEHCAKLHQEILQPLEKKYSNEICIIIRDRPLDLFSLQASILTYCQPKNTHNIQKRLFETQKEWLPAFEETKKLSKKDAHGLVKERLNKVIKIHENDKKRCQAYFDFTMLQKAAKILSKNQEFQKIEETPLVFLYTPERNKKSKEIVYGSPQELSLAQMTLSKVEEAVNKSRAQFFS